MSAPIKLNFSGYYTYTAWKNLSDDGFSTFTLNLNSDGLAYGSGSDNLGPFNISGALIGDNLRFVKQYTSGKNVTWKYIGKRVAPTGNVYQFVGTWGYPKQSKAAGEFVFSAMKPQEPIEGYWTGHYFSNHFSNRATQGSQTNLAVSLDHDAPSPPNGPFSIVGNGWDEAGAFEIKGAVTKVNPDGSGGQIAFIKSYSSWKWKYQGKYNGRGSIEGTWGDDVAGEQTNGSFKLMQMAKFTAELAAPMMKVAVRSLPCSPTLASAVQIASDNNSGATPSDVLTLINSFTS